VSQEFARALDAGGEGHWEPPLSYFVLDLPANWEEFRSSLKRNIRESLRHCYNSLKRDGHRFELQVIEDPAGVRQGLDKFLALHTMRANAAHKVVHPDRFANRICREFLYAVCDRLAARGAVRLFALKIGAQVVAMRLGFVVGDSLYLYYSGYDPFWARYSVMTTTVAEAIKYAIAHDMKTVNLSTNREISKLRWGPRQVDCGSAFEANTRLKSRLARSAYLTARSETGLPSRVLQLISTRRSWK
jgi:CelD/BcsL family acetyltransferase involved in cellulose biosynthesis